MQRVGLTSRPETAMSWDHEGVDHQDLTNDLKQSDKLYTVCFVYIPSRSIRVSLLIIGYGICSCDPMNDFHESWTFVNAYYGADDVLRYHYLSVSL